MDKLTISIMLIVSVQRIKQARDMANSGTFKGRARVAVVDDDEDIHLWLKDVLQSQKSFVFAGGFFTGKEALSGLPSLRPDLALVDIRLPDMDGIQCTERLRRLVPPLKIVILSGYHDADLIDRASRAGAITFLVKPVDPVQLIVTLHVVAVHNIENNRNPDARSTGFSPEMAAAVKSHLTPREEEVLSRLAEGKYYKEISDKLGIRFRTVQKHCGNIYKKFRVNNRSEAIRVWINRSR
jgi:DNA-binding NarL/FixJ family response regulator